MIILLLLLWLPLAPPSTPKAWESWGGCRWQLAMALGMFVGQSNSLEARWGAAPSMIQMATLATKL